MVRETSIEVFKQITEKGLLSKKREEVYKVLYVNGPMTGSQLSKLIRSTHFVTSLSETVRNRLTELVQWGVAKELGEVKCPVTGYNVTLYDVTSALPQKPVLPKGRAERKKMLVDRIERLYYEIDLFYKDEIKEIWDLAKEV